MENNNPKPNTNIRSVVSDSWIEITDREYRLLADLVYDKIGINLTDQKRNLLMGRLQKILRQKQFKSFNEYYEYIISDKSGVALSDLANYISTNHTFFYREKDHFEFFLKIALPELTARLRNRNSHDLRVWSAGCSSGEEPYTLIMIMMEYFGAEYDRWDAGILATDISEKALGIAKNAIYGEERIKYLPPLYIKKYFKKLPDGQYQVIDKVRNEVVYRRFNLMNEQFPFKNKFDAIFCRNVMIYFDNPTRKTLVDKFYNLTTNGGYFFIGHSETLKRDDFQYKYIMPALYKKE